MTRLTVMCAVVVVVACSFSLKSMATRIYMHNRCSVTMCGRYWGGNDVGGSCSGLAPSDTWTVTASPNWKQVSMWAIQSGCEGQRCSEADPGAGFTTFKIEVDGFDHKDYYQIPGSKTSFNVAMKVTPTKSGCPSDFCSGDFLNDRYQDPQICPTGTDYDLDLCARN